MNRRMVLAMALLAGAGLQGGGSVTQQVLQQTPASQLQSVEDMTPGTPGSTEPTSPAAPSGGEAPVDLGK